MLISTNDSLCQPIPKRRKSGLCCHAYFSSTGILTCFPFPLFLLGSRLGSTYPSLNCIEQGNLALPVALILTVLCSYYHQDSHSLQVHISSRKCFCPARTPAYHKAFGLSMVSVTALVPSIFKTHILDK